MVTIPAFFGQRGGAHHLPHHDHEISLPQPNSFIDFFLLLNNFVTSPKASPALMEIVWSCSGKLIPRAATCDLYVEPTQYDLEHL